VYLCLDRVSGWRRRNCPGLELSDLSSRWRSRLWWRRSSWRSSLRRDRWSEQEVEQHAGELRQDALVSCWSQTDIIRARRCPTKIRSRSASYMDVWHAAFLRMHMNMKVLIACASFLICLCPSIMHSLNGSRICKCLFWILLLPHWLAHRCIRFSFARKGVVPGTRRWCHHDLEPWWIRISSADRGRLPAYRSQAQTALSADVIRMTSRLRRVTLMTSGV
jgi:hypothetical protein